MKTVWKNYRGPIFLLAGLIIGGLCGAFFGTKVDVVKPLGDLFLNLMYMVLIPLVFFSISSAISGMTNVTRLGKILGTTIMVFLGTSLIAAIFGYLAVLIFNPINSFDMTSIKHLMGTVKGAGASGDSWLSQLVSTFTVDDFNKILTKNHMLSLIIVAILTGIATSTSGKAAEPFAKVLAAGNVVTMKIVKYIMYYAPIGLGCYFATVIGNLGAEMASTYLRTLLVYIGFAIFYFFIIMSGYAFIAGGKAGFKIFWKNISAPAITAIATSSSAASIPVNIEYTKKMGVTDDIAETVIPLGANIHKDGSVVGGILKATFLFVLFGKPINTLQDAVLIICVGFLVGVVMSAIPGGGFVAETVIITVFGFPMSALPLILIISEIIDIPATLLNSSSNTTSGMLVARIVEGKDWLKKA
ncbi:proton glutamate symport protein [Paucilactobacillus oligofermentans DSM 15707 = LMG 22743]|uniref:Proton glutamate symport protein n=1 Tax=Paucilactobacillus oligofermentans DSM 15707 = LMG 22743 TaxID=1423778 RepID=A0A0R1RF72_9LACO|nr:dicarboxylate/amino acid:cation symporter [Paucilactobacillus oligofermentans]KRL55712.1 proton glutamate symport protein [Paucilactobacillus oligofermentans DSM 15707 = LMG 22743]CUS27072.1 Proton/sodium-glutamate symport protein [Paucilactobacillus oligofermentans DSM 15707 = LMG 22743]